jgi:hypothetical protein
VSGERTGRTAVLAVFAVAWSVWCLLAAAPVSILVTLGAWLAGRPALAENVALGVAVEAALLAATGWIAFRLLRRSRPPRSFWIAGPAGYLAAFAAYLVISRLAGDTVVQIAAANVLEISAVSAAVGIAAWLGVGREIVAGARVVTNAPRSAAD